MATSFSKIYENVLPKFKDYNLAKMTDEEIEECLHDYLLSAVSKFHVCRTDLTVDEEQKCFVADLKDIEVEIISNFLVIDYIDSNNIRIPSIMKAHLSSSDFNTYSNANLLDKLMAMRNKYIYENEALLSRYAWLELGESKDESESSLSKLKKAVGKNK